jgi:hypothetical protein
MDVEQPTLELTATLVAPAIVRTQGASRDTRQIWQRLIP